MGLEEQVWSPPGLERSAELLPRGTWCGSDGMRWPPDKSLSLEVTVMFAAPHLTMMAAIITVRTVMWEDSHGCTGALTERKLEGLR